MYYKRLKSFSYYRKNKLCSYDIDLINIIHNVKKNKNDLLRILN